MLTYIRVSFWFFPKKVRLVLKIGLGLVFVLGLGLGFRFEFGFGKLIGGAVGTVGWVSRKSPVVFGWLHLPL